MHNKLSVFILLTLALGCARSPESNPKYIVVLKQEQVDAASDGSDDPHEAIRELASEVAQANGAPEPARVFSHALAAGVYHLTEEQAGALAHDPRVAFIEKDQIFRANATQTGATWGIDRIDQASLPLNRSYIYSDSGAVVNAYVIDTGIYTPHQDFKGRAVSAVDFVDKDQDATDCNGHGTHVAGTIGSNTYGVAKKVKLWGVRVLDCEGSGTTASVIAGIEWVKKNHIKPAVANMSLGGGASKALDAAVQASIKAGVTYVVAAGNESAKACSSSPSRVPEAITVGATTNSDARASYSNYGTCVDLFAPGSNITSLWIDSNSATNTINGTSMASPHVAGVAALYLAKHPSAKPAEVVAALKKGAVSGKLSSIGSGSPNLLLNTMFLK